LNPPAASSVHQNGRVGDYLAAHPRKPGWEEANYLAHIMAWRKKQRGTLSVIRGGSVGLGTVDVCLARPALMGAAASTWSQNCAVACFRCGSEEMRALS